MDPNYLAPTTYTKLLHTSLVDVIRLEYAEIADRFEGRFSAEGFDSAVMYFLPLHHQCRVAGVLEDLLRQRASHIESGVIETFHGSCRKVDGKWKYCSDDNDVEEEAIGTDNYARDPINSPFYLVNIEPAEITVDSAPLRTIAICCDGNTFVDDSGYWPTASLPSIAHLLPADTVSLELSACVIDPQEVSDFMNSWKCNTTLHIRDVKVADNAASNVIDCSTMRSVRIELTYQNNDVIIADSDSDNDNNIVIDNIGEFNRRPLVFAPSPSVRKVELIDFAATASEGVVDFNIAYSFPNAIALSIIGNCAQLIQDGYMAQLLRGSSISRLSFKLVEFGNFYCGDHHGSPQIEHIEYDNCLLKSPPILSGINYPMLKTVRFMMNCTERIYHTRSSGEYYRKVASFGKLFERLMMSYPEKRFVPAHVPHVEDPDSVVPHFPAHARTKHEYSFISASILGPLGAYIPDYSQYSTESTDDIIRRYFFLCCAQYFWQRRFIKLSKITPPILIQI